MCIRLYRNSAEAWSCRLGNRLVKQRKTVKNMKVKVFLMISVLLMFTGVVQHSVEAFNGVFPPGRRQLSSTEVCSFLLKEMQ